MHGDDFVVAGARRHLEWLHRELERTILLKRVGVLGLDLAADDTQEVQVLNWVLRINEDGVQYEADPRHAEILAAMLAPSTSPVSSPGLRESPGPFRDERADSKVFSLDGDSCEHAAGWGSEEEEEYAEGSHEAEACVVRRARPGRRERAAARDNGSW